MLPYAVLFGWRMFGAMGAEDRDPVFVFTLVMLWLAYPLALLHRIRS